jgi:hypothetical protein
MVKKVALLNGFYACVASKLYMLSIIMLNVFMMNVVALRQQGRM